MVDKLLARDSELSGLTAPSNRTLSDQVAHQLRHAIISGQLTPGQRILEQEIAEAMNISRGPVRDALMQLENERLIIRYAHRGTFVASLTLHDVEEIYSFREAIECLAIAYAVRRATDEQIDELEALVEAMVNCAKRGYTEVDATEIDLEFHHALCRISGHSRLLSAWEALSSEVRMLVLSHRTLQPTDFAEKGAESHRQIVEALRAHSVRSARMQMRRHLASSFRTVAESRAQLEPAAEDRNPG